jgi:RNA 3'-terminal phosphate cyclase
VDEARIETPSACGAGNAVVLPLEYAALTTIISEVEEKGRPAEDVAAAVVDAAQRYEQTGAPAGSYLADQLLP